MIESKQIKGKWVCAVCGCKSELPHTVKCPNGCKVGDSTPPVKEGPEIAVVDELAELQEEFSILRSRIEQVAEQAGSSTRYTVTVGFLKECVNLIQDRVLTALEMAALYAADRDDTVKDVYRKPSG